MMDGNNIAETIEDLQERAETIKQKFVQRKNTKHIKSTRKVKKVRQKGSVVKTEKAIHLKGVDKKLKKDPDPLNVYNKEGKLFFSKVKIDGEKLKKQSYATNPIINLQKLNSQAKKIQDLVESGDKMKAKEVKEKMLWKVAFDKADSVKVKDKAHVLKKTIKKRKMEKTKSKDQWSKRKEKVEEKQSARTKKREGNLEKRKTDNKKGKLKNAIKKGRIIKGITG